MSFNQQTSLVPVYFVLSDSHGTFVPSLATTSSHRIIVKFSSGLSWLNKHKSHLSAVSQIQTRAIASHISSSKSILLLIGTNSIRFSPAALVLNQVKNFIFLLRNHHRHLVDKTSINIVAVFPCRKTSSSFPTYGSLQQNIDSYNQQLFTLSNDLNFTVVDFQVKPYHLGNDNIDIHLDHRELVKDSIFKYFNSLEPQSSSPTITTNCRSNQALARRNERKHEKLAQKQKILQLKRPITPPWTLDYVKKFLKKNQIKVAKLPPIHKNILRLRFNHSISLQQANEALPKDVFSKEHFPQCFSL